MIGSSQEVVARIVDRFLHLRSSGKRLSVDEVLEGFREQGDLASIRNDVLKLIALRGSSQDHTGPSEANSAIAGERDAAAPFPELEGYDLVDLLGRGGMGAVYEAYQRSTGRRVAVKILLHEDVASAASRRRFEREVELIARLEHPGIVSIIDSGLHRGRYFYVMEYVEGRLLNAAVEPGQADARPALQLLVDVCEAVDYAHQRGVLHRDLKPSNILIDQRGRARVLDFGLGRAVDPEGAAANPRSISQPGQLLGTLGYMPPEQARGDPDGTSVRSDVYSLGAIGYELVTGQLPIFLDGPLGAVLERIENQDPRPPSAHRRRRDADLDAILLKALEKAPARRYATAGELSADLRRYLGHETVSARRTGWPTRAARWVRRNRAVAAVGSAAAILVVSITSIAFYRVLAAQHRAEAEARRKTQTADLWEEWTRNIELAKAKGPEVGNRQTFEQVDHRLREVFPDSPEDRAIQHQKLGTIWRDASVFDRAEQHLEKALELRCSLQPQPNPSVAETLIQLGYTYKKQGKYEQAKPLYEEAVQIHRRLFDRLGEADDLTYLGKLANDTFDYVAAADAYDRGLAIWAGLPTEQVKPLEVTNLRYNKALLKLYTGRFAEAEAELRQFLPVYRSADGARYAECLNSLACAICKQTRYGEAEGVCRDGLAIREKLFPHEQYPDGNLEIVGSSMVLSEILLGQGRAAEAEPLLRQCVAVGERKAKSHEKAPVIRSLLGASLMGQGRFEDAEPLLKESYESLRQKRGDRDIETLAARERLTSLYAQWGRPAGALP